MGASLFDEMSRMGLSPIHVWGMTELGGAGTFLSPERWPAHPGAIGSSVSKDIHRGAVETADMR